MVMRSMREGAKGGISKFILFGLMTVAVGGLVLMDVGGFFRGGVGSGDVARVGNEKIQITTFDRAVRRALARAGVSPQEALKLGYINEILGNEIRGSLMQQAAHDLGVRVGKDRIAQQVARIIQPMVEEGQPPQQVLNQILMSQGMSEGEFVRAINREMTASILGQAVQAGFVGTPESVARDMYRFNNEKRDIELIVLNDKDSKDVKPPSEEQLKGMYESLKENFATPETRKVTLAFVPEKTASSIEVTEDEVRAAYDDNIDAYSVPEERKLEQSAFKSEDEAKAVFELVKNGAPLKKAIEDVTKKTDAYLGEEKFQKDGLIEDISKPVFAAEKTGEVIGPVKSPLGWHILVLKEIIEPKTKSFESVRKELEDDIRQSRLADATYENANAVDDMLAGGMGFNEAIKEAGLKVVDLGSFNAFGQGKDGKDALENYKEYRDNILKTAYDLQEGETSAVMEMPDGKFLTVHVESIAEKTYKPFEEAKGGIEKKWMEDQRRLNARMQATAYLTMIEAKDKTMEDVAQEIGTSVRKVEIGRAGNIADPLNPQAAGILFETAEHDYALLGLDGATAIARVAKITLPQGNELKDEEIKELAANMNRGGRNEALMMYLDAKERSYKVRVNPKILQTVYGANAENP